MSTPDQAWWGRARRARERLELLAMGHPDVRMISIGLDPQRQSHDPVLIVYLRPGAAPPPSLPGDVDGIIVRVAHGDYEVQKGQP